MSRESLRLQSDQEKNRGDIMKKQTHFYVAMYLRLSRDDGDRDGISRLESNSIGSQRELIRSFLREQEDMELYDSYVDDGFSGSNFVGVR